MIGADGFTGGPLGAGTLNIDTCTILSQQFGGIVAFGGGGDAPWTVNITNTFISSGNFGMVNNDPVTYNISRSAIYAVGSHSIFDNGANAS